MALKWNCTYESYFRVAITYFLVSNLKPYVSEISTGSRKNRCIIAALEIFRIHKY